MRQGENAGVPHTNLHMDVLWLASARVEVRDVSKVYGGEHKISGHKIRLSQNHTVTKSPLPDMGLAFFSSTTTAGKDTHRQRLICWCIGDNAEGVGIDSCDQTFRHFLL